ncbi:Predicted arabinose efflux permease, MFS family [Pedobacter steynii]|uniref:Predicted arabinose efflux permease, MFS family n=1 Tax=Pedobacter steynii TaxID=430522 RepID=A0A1H0M791_9SPHI|nr:MFS transporter [Pedobacter steynii]NQX43597.1 MFS transporter [Pedobacter steynii]SDO76161.1 Predicted arabinose efflux permease, MFS family [Pedobacter steynii]
MDSPGIIEKPDPYAALRYPEFRSYLGMRFFFTFAYQMQAVIIGFHIYHLTKDPLALGLVGLCEAIPAISIALYGGYVADKSEKRGLLLKVFTGVFLCSLIMLVITTNQMHAYVPVSYIVPIMYLMVFGIGIARGFFSPATFSLMAQIIPKKLYPNSSTWNSSSWQAASILGPATGGLIYGFYGITATYSVILAFIAIALVCIFFLKPHPPTYIPKESIVKSLTEGVHFVFKNKMMLGAMSLDLFSVFFGGAVALLPVFANDILKVGSEGLGFMRAAASSGAVITMLAMTRFSPMNKPWRNLLIAVTGFGTSIICYGLSKNFYLTLLFLFMEGAFDSISVIIRSTIMQLLTPDEMRGRVSAVNSMFIGSSNEIGAFESGLTAKLMRTVPAVVFGGSMTILVAGITYLKTKGLMKLTLQEINDQQT